MGMRRLRLAGPPPRKRRERGGRPGTEAARSPEGVPATIGVRWRTLVPALCYSGDATGSRGTGVSSPLSAGQLAALATPGLVDSEVAEMAQAFVASVRTGDATRRRPWRDRALCRTCPERRRDMPLVPAVAVIGLGGGVIGGPLHSVSAMTGTGVVGGSAPGGNPMDSLLALAAHVAGR